MRRRRCAQSVMRAERDALCAMLAVRTCDPPRVLDSKPTGGRGGEQKRWSPSTRTRNRKVRGAAEGLARPVPPLNDARLLLLASRARVCGAMRGGRCDRPSSASSSSSDPPSEPSSLVFDDDSVLSDSRSVPDVSALAIAPPYE